MKILNNLNEEQLQAVEYNAGPHMIVAGAGSGKTRVLTYKIALLIEKGIEPSAILALTFTNKAAKEMKERIKSLIGKKAEELWMGTFHSIFSKMLRVESEKIGYRPNYSIYDREDSVSLVSNIIANLNINLESITANGVQHKISFLKNQMIMPLDYEKSSGLTPTDKKFVEVYTEYNKRLFENNAMDFDDLLIKPIQLFKENEKTLAKYKKMFKYILVDEYQDTNIAQYELLKILCPAKDKICVVGDDAQSIYSWRGAEIKNMLNFKKDFTGSKIFRLEQNYRSTKMILEAADSVIKNNSSQIPKTLWTDNSKGEPLTLIRSADEKDEAYQIARKIKKEVTTRKISLNDIVLFYRLNSQSRALEDALRREKIPYKIIGGVEFYRRKEVKDVLAYMRVLANSNDEESLLRIMNFPQRGIGNTSITKMIAFARKLNLSLFKTMLRVFEVIEVKERIQKNVKQFKLLLDKYIDLKEKLSIGELISALLDELGILRIYKEEGTTESMSRYDNIQELVSAVHEYSKTNPKATIEDFLAEVSLIAGVDQYDEKAHAVTLMTIHSSKGLEFPVVFVTGLEEDIFPLSQRFDQDSKIEEERRLFYVAVTRAKVKVYLSYARSRYRFGEVAYQSKSRFLDEVDESTIEESDGSGVKKAGRRKKVYYDEYYQQSFEDYDQDRRSLRVGSRVTHQLFGIGKIQQITGTGDMQRVTIAFEKVGIKQLLTKFANLKLI